MVYISIWVPAFAGMTPSAKRHNVNLAFLSAELYVQFRIKDENVNVEIYQEFFCCILFVVCFF